jgi:hypothetical protein
MDFVIFKRVLQNRVVVLSIANLILNLLKLDLTLLRAIRNVVGCHVHCWIYSHVVWHLRRVSALILGLFQFFHDLPMFLSEASLFFVKLHVLQMALKVVLDVLFGDGCIRWGCLRPANWGKGWICSSPTTRVHREADLVSVQVP